MSLAHPHRCFTIESEVAKARVELARHCGHDILSVACLPVPPLGCFDRSTAGGSRTLKHERLKFAALPVCVPQHVD